ncbi:hypothetical protein [Achromobacter insolitus]|uniref:hypothetical protein n=1 Tax=Achromobacter insolitus TaxID=217204 RepID=UPI0007C34BF3|nr:hypothetical protein [Achromobacter insolitus]OAD17164.1 hypothetical protein A3839_24500 [Achromobacter insolitus]
MNKEELEQIAQRPSCCKPFGASVTLSVGERDELVAMARDGERAQTLVAALHLAECEMRYAGWFATQTDNVGRQPAYTAVCAALASVDAVVAKEEA